MAPNPFSRKKELSSRGEVLPSDPTSGFLSFMLPGLGQVYQGWYGRGITLFIAFIIVSVFRDGRILLPFAALLAGFEAYRPKARREMWSTWDEALSTFWSRWLTDRTRPTRYRKPLYAGVGIMGFLAWFTLFAPALYPFEAQAQLNDTAEVIADRVRDFRATNGGLPQDTDLLLRANEPQETLLDPWKKKLLIKPMESGFAVQSLGKDGVEGTRDDFQYKFR